MPLTPEFLLSELNYLQTHKALQESVLRDIVRRILKTDFTLSETAEWQAEKLMQSGMLFEDILKEIGARTEKTEAEIQKIFDDSSTEVFNFPDEIIESAGHKPEALTNLSPSMKMAISAAARKTCTEALNLTKTTAVTTQDLYIQSADLAHMQIVSGAFSYRDAVKNAILSAAQKGLTVLYPPPAEHKSSLDAAMRRAVLTGVNQTYGKMSEDRAEELKIDIMEITAHAGARPDHAAWQGRLVSRSGKKGYLSLSDIGYGSVTGFMGANCRHNWFPFFEGISKRAYTDEELKRLAEDTVEYGGEKMTLYEATQKQRSLERKIRKTKSELVALDEAIKNAGDDDLATAFRLDFERDSVLLKGQEAKLSDFCEKTGLDRDRYREQVFSTETENGLRGFGKSTSAKAIHVAKKHYEQFKFQYNAEKLPKTLDKYYRMKYNKSPAYKVLKQYTHMVDSGEVCAIFGFDQYIKHAKQIEKELFGIFTVNGIEIKESADHFVGRQVGRVGYINKFKQKNYNRPGVTVDELRLCLTKGNIVKTQTDNKGQNSIKLTYGDVEVSVNPNTGVLIQTNRKRE